MTHLTASGVPGCQTTPLTTLARFVAPTIWTATADEHARTVQPALRQLDEQPPSAFARLLEQVTRSSAYLGRYRVGRSSGGLKRRPTRRSTPSHHLCDFASLHGFQHDSLLRKPEGFVDRTDSGHPSQAISSPSLHRRKHSLSAKTRTWKLERSPTEDPSLDQSDAYSIRSRCINLENLLFVCCKPIKLAHAKH